jgi:hypothetical protein
VNAYNECTSPNRVHGPPLASPSCNPPAPTSPNLTVGTPDANSRAANFTGLIGFDVLLGNPGTPADEADVSISAILGDIRLLSNTNDYTGDLQAQVTLQITDRLNGPGQNEVGTTSNVPFSFTIPCTATSGTGNVGSNCIVNTSADAVLPGAVTETKRTIWEIKDVQVFDGGPDGQVSTPGNSVYLRQGLFVP